MGCCSSLGTWDVGKAGSFCLLAFSTLKGFALFHCIYNESKVETTLRIFSAMRLRSFALKMFLYFKRL